MKETVRHYIKHRSSEHTTVLGLISDQSPRLTAESQWIDFLNQKTIFIEGSERLAMKFKIPVYFVVTERICLGGYRISFIEIYDGKEPIKEGDITRRYAEELEKMIRRTPELWMWSHKRWKHTPEKQAAKFGASTLK
jgi:KDO2-lipid IV(A) lauroyltransferase